MFTRISSIFIISIILIVLGGVLQETAANTEENKAIQRRVFEEVWNQGNLDLADELFASDCVIHNPPNPDVIGPGAFKGMVTMYRAAFPDTQWTVDNQIAEGDLVATRLTGTGTHQGELIGISPTGIQTTVTMIAIVRIASGKIKESWSISDQLGLLQQLGVIPAMGREDFTWGEPMESETAPTVDPEENKAIVRRIWEEIWNQGNLDLVDEFYATDYVRHDPVNPGVRGPEGHKQLVSKYRTAFPDLQFTIENQVAEGNMVATRWTALGTHQGEFMSIPPTGVQGTLTATIIHRFANGKIEETWLSWDALGMMQQLGVIPPLGPPPTKEIETGSVSLDSWLAITKQIDFTPEERPDGLYLVATTLVEFMGDATFTFDASGNKITFKSVLRGEFQELKVNFDKAGVPISAIGPARGSTEMLDADGNVAFYGTYMMNQTLHLAPDFTPTGANPIGYSISTGVGDYAGCHIWLATEGNLAPNPQNPKEIGYALAGKGELTKQVITRKPPTGRHVSEAWYRYKQDYDLVPEKRADGLYLVSTRPAIAMGEYTYIFDTGEKIIGQCHMSGTHQELKVIFDESGVPIRAVGSSYGGTIRGADSYGNILEGVFRFEPNVSLSPDMTPTGVTAKATVISQLKGKFADYIATDNLIVTPVPDPQDPTKMVYHGVGTGVMTEVTGLSSVGMHAMKLESGLNMLSLPLKPLEPYTARSFSEMLGATTIITLDEKRQRLVGFTPDESGDGFPIEAGKGYIVNVLKPTEVEFLGTIWGNITLHEAAPPIVQRDSAWAFVVNVTMDDTELWIQVENKSTGASLMTVSDWNGRYSGAWADMTRKPVIRVGDVLEVIVSNESGVVGKLPYTVTSSDIQKAYATIPLDIRALHPLETMLYQNYPNPFNPETWIPYQLKEPAEVIIRIYDVSGRMVRMLDLGQRAAGFYLGRSRAAHWNGHNDAGEKVTSGVYFYQIKTGDFSAMRKMVIVK